MRPGSSRQPRLSQLRLPKPPGPIVRSLRATALALGLCLGGGPVGDSMAAAPVSPALSALPPSRLTAGERIRQLLDSGSWAPAESLSTVELDRVRGSVPLDSLALAEAMQSVVRARIGAGRVRIEGTREMADSALALRERQLGPEDPLLAESLYTLGRLLWSQGDLAGTKPLYERCLAIREKTLGPDHELVGASLNGLGILAAQTGNYPAARNYFERSIAVRERALGPDHREVGDSASNLAFVLAEEGDFVAARAARERTLRIYEATFGPDHPRLAGVLGNLGDVLRHMGDYEEAIALEERALAIAEAGMPADSPELAGVMSNFAELLTLAGFSDRALPLFEQALRIREAAFGPDHPSVATTLINLAELRRRSGDAAEAARLAARGAPIIEKRAGASSADAATALLTLACAKRDLGELAAADRLMARILESRVATFGPDNPRVGEVLRDLAVGRLAAGDADSAITLALRAETIGREHFRLLARSLPERQALRFAASRTWGLDVALAAATQHPEPGRVTALWDAVIVSRGLVLDEMAERQHLTWRSDSPGVTARRETLLLADRELARLLVSGAGGRDGDAFRRGLDAARLRRETAERALAEASADYRGARDRHSIGLAEVRAALPPRSALVAYVRHRRTGAADIAADTRYVAFVLSDPTEAAPRFVPLGDAAAIDRLVEAWRSEAARGTLVAGRTPAAAEAACRAAGTALRGAVWDPITPYVASADRIFVVPDGLLHLVNPAALPVGPPDAGGFLVDRDPVLHVVSLERDLVPPAAPSAPGEGLLALGGALFDGGGAAAKTPRSEAAAFRGATARCPLFRDVRFAPLPGSLREAEEVAALWKRSSGARGEVHVLQREDATEAAVKRLAPGRRVLHLASHGFFIGAGCEESPAAGARGIGGLVAARPGAPPPPRTPAPTPAAAPAATIPSTTPSAANPLRLSGIALAGANRREEADPAGEDGVLTAEEIATLDLGGVEWAVLSACDTGLGDIRSGEGVFGLRRALQVAGARSVILSLWSVRDQDTRHWMEALYRARLVGRHDTAESVREASLALLTARRRAGQSTHPFYWAGFLATGEWR